MPVKWTKPKKAKDEKPPKGGLKLAAPKNKPTEAKAKKGAK